MRSRKSKWGFREILKSEPKGIEVVLCNSNSSPQCMNKFIPVRKKQKMCLKCLVFNNLIDDKPVIHYENPEE